MTDEENTNVEQPAVQAVVEAPESETQDQAAAPKEEKRRNDAAYNWAEQNRVIKEMREQNRAMQEQLNKLNRPQEPEVDELDKLADDDIITKAHAKKMAEKMARQIANEVIKQRENATVDDRLQIKFPDFADVVTKEAIEELKQTEPELAFSLANNPDPFAQGVAAYKLLKRLGRGVDPAVAQDKKKAQENSQKPISVNAVTKNSAIGNAHLFENGLTPELKKSLWKEMEEARKRM